MHSRFNMYFPIIHYLLSLKSGHDFHLITLNVGKINLLFDKRFPTVFGSAFFVQIFFKLKIVDLAQLPSQLEPRQSAIGDSLF